MSIIKLDILLLSLSCFISFTWAIQRFFLKPFSQRNVGMMSIYIFGSIFSFVHLFAIIYCTHFNLISTITAMLLYLSSLGLFWWSVYITREKPFSIAFSPDVPSSIVIEGPYCLVRHPFYTSYTLTWVAGTIVVQKLLMLPTVLIMLGLYWYAARYEEKKFSDSPLSLQYERYQARVGMFIPKLFTLVK